MGNTPRQTKPESQMKLTDRVELNLPFSGFYNSLYSGAVDDWERDTAEQQVEQEEAQPEHRRLSLDELESIILDCMDYNLAYQNVAESYMSAYDDELSETLSVKLGLQWSLMTSPREYNFETDRIFVTVSYATVLRLFALSKRDGHKELGEMISARHTSRSGFHSFMSSDLAEWLEKPLADWDHNELSTLLRAMVALHDPDKDWEMSVYYKTTDDSCTAECDPAINWNKLEEKAEELRADKDADFADENPDYVPPQPRCSDTMEMFPKA